MYQYESISARENMFPKERSILELLAYGKDKRQKYQVIKFINKSQYYFLKKIAANILQGIIPLKKHQLNHLKSSKILKRKLAEGRVASSDLVRHCMSISYIVKIAIEHYEKHSKTSTGSNRKMETNRRQQFYERSFSGNSSSDETASSQESNFSTESEQSRRFRKNREIESNSDVPLSFSEEEK